MCYNSLPDTILKGSNFVRNNLDRNQFGFLQESSGLLILWITMMGLDVAIEVIYLVYLACSHQVNDS
jgi:hypothetical protein